MQNSENFMNSYPVATDVSGKEMADVALFFHDNSTDDLMIEYEKAKQVVRSILGESVEALYSEDYHKTLSDFLNDGKGKTDVLFFAFMQVVIHVQPENIDDTMQKTLESYQGYVNGLIKMHKNLENLSKVENLDRLVEIDAIINRNIMNSFPVSKQSKGRNNRASSQEAKAFKQMNAVAPEGTVKELASKYGKSITEIRKLKKEGMLHTLSE